MLEIRLETVSLVYENLKFIKINYDSFLRFYKIKLANRCAVINSFVRSHLIDRKLFAHLLKLLKLIKLFVNYRIKL